MPKAGVLTNANQVENSISNADKSLIKGLIQYTRDVAVDVHATSKVESPIRTGFLRNSHLLEKLSDFEWQMIVNAGYGGFVHDGTRFQNPNPWVSRSVRAVVARRSGGTFAIAT